MLVFVCPVLRLCIGLFSIVWDKLNSFYKHGKPVGVSCPFAVWVYFNLALRWFLPLSFCLFGPLLRLCFGLFSIVGDKEQPYKVSSLWGGDICPFRVGTLPCPPLLPCPALRYSNIVALTRDALLSGSMLGKKLAGSKVMDTVPDLTCSTSTQRQRFAPPRPNPSAI